MSADPRIERMAQVIHDARVYIHPDAPQAIKDARGKPTHADFEAAIRIYESPDIRRDLAETNMPDGSNWLARVKREAATEALDGALKAMDSDTSLFDRLEARLMADSNPSAQADDVQEIAVGWLRARAAEYRHPLRSHGHQPVVGWHSTQRRQAIPHPVRNHKPASRRLLPHRGRHARTRPEEGMTDRSAARKVAWYNYLAMANRMRNLDGLPPLDANDRNYPALMTGFYIGFDAGSNWVLADMTKEE